MNKQREIEYDLLYMDLAMRISEMSYAVRNRVGCVIVKDHNIISYGFNGTPTGFDNTCEVEVEGVLITKPEVLHAESNAISKLAKIGVSSEEASIYITLSPCFECAKLLIQAGIKKVFYKNEYRKIDGLELLEQANIQIHQIK